MNLNYNHPELSYIEKHLMSVVSPTQKISSTNEVRLYCDWWHASEVFLEEAKIRYDKANTLLVKTDYSYFIHASLTFSAFTLEAYINHIIPYFYKCDCKVYELKNIWNNIEIICKRLEISNNYGKDPWQSIKQLFKNHRNRIAHSRTENLTDEKDYHCSYDNDLTKFRLESSLQQYATVEKAFHVRNQLSVILNQIHECGKERKIIPDHDYLFRHGNGTYLIKHQS